VKATWLSRDLLKFVDEYCQWYQPLFAEVSFEAFKQLRTDQRGQTLPAIEGWIRQRAIVAESPWQIPVFDNIA